MCAQLRCALHEPVWVGGRFGKGLAKAVPHVVIADQKMDRPWQTVQQAAQVLVLLGDAMVRQVAGQHQGVCIGVVLRGMRQAGAEPFGRIKANDPLPRFGDVDIGHHQHLGGKPVHVASFRALAIPYVKHPDGVDGHVIRCYGSSAPAYTDYRDDNWAVRGRTSLPVHLRDDFEAAVPAARLRRGSVVIMMHHPPFITGFPGMDRIGLASRTAFNQIIADSPAVAMVVAGHVHRTIWGSAGGKPCAVLKSPCHQMPMDLTSADSSLSIDEPGAYGVLLLGDAGVTLLSEDVGLPGQAVSDPDSV